jgi:hypothetical protein
VRKDFPGCADQELPDVIIPIGFLQKTNPDGSPKHRIILDASRPKGDSINDHAVAGQCRYANIEMACAAMSTGPLQPAFYRCDFEDAFMQLVLSLFSRRYTGVRWKGKIWCYKRGCFGFKNLPYFQQSVTVALIRATVRRLRKSGLATGDPPSYTQHFPYNRPGNHWSHYHTTLLGFLDDIAGVANSMKAATLGFLTLIWICHSVGVKVSTKPGKTVPPSTEDMVWLGYLLSLKTLTISLEADRCAKLYATMSGIQGKGELSMHELQSLIGVLVFMCSVLGMKVYYRSMIELLIASRGQHRITLSEEVRSDIGKWFMICKLFNGRTIMTGIRKAAVRWPAYTDASFSGWGWCWAGIVAPGLFPRAWKGRFGRKSKRKLQSTGSWQQLQLETDVSTDLEPARIWINFCECLAVLFLLRSMIGFCVNQRLTLYCDNQAVCSMLRRLQTASLPCKPVLAEICWLLAAHNTELLIFYIRSEHNIVSDAASRLHSSKISKPEFIKIVNNYRRGCPETLRSVGLRKQRPARPELLQVMDVWTAVDDEGEVGWCPAPLQRRNSDVPLLVSSQIRNKRTILQYALL